MIGIHKYLKRLNVLFFLSIYEISCLFAGNSEFPVDTTIVRYLDLSDVEENEKIIYNLKVVNWNTPVKFQIFILSQNDTC